MADALIRIQKLTATARNPVRKTKGAAGFDLHADLTDPLVIQPGQRALVPTGLAMAIPQGFEGCVRPRSGLAWKQGLTVLNAPGTIDSDYRGEVKVILYNASGDAVTIAPEDRIAQMVIQRLLDVRWETMEFMGESQLDETERGSGGFGSTGV